MKKDQGNSIQTHDSNAEEGAKESWLEKVVKERGFLGGKIEIPKDSTSWLVTFLFMILAYMLSIWIRMEWMDFAQTNYTDENGEIQYLYPEMLKDGMALPNTHDSFYFGSVLQKALFNKHEENHLVPGVLHNGMITLLPYVIMKLFPDTFTIEELLLKLPIWVAGFVCFPIVLIGRLYGSALWGFLAACLAGIAHSFYNRTLAGYYDTDIFSITLPAFCLYFILSSSRLITDSK